MTGQELQHKAGTGSSLLQGTRHEYAPFPMDSQNWANNQVAHAEIHLEEFAETCHTDTESHICKDEKAYIMVSL